MIHQLFFLVTTAVLFTSELYYLNLKLNSEYSWQQLANIHFAVTGIGAAITLIIFIGCKRYPRIKLWYAYLLLLQFFLGPYGSAGCLLSFIYVSLFHKSTENDNLDMLRPDTKENHTLEVYNKVAMINFEDERSSVIPFQDLLSLGTMQQKKRALTKIARYYTPTFAPLLRQALNDPENVIRVQAASIKVKVENQLMGELIALEKKLEKDPNNPDLLKEVAKQSDYYAYTDILDESTQEKYRIQAIASYQKYLELNPNDESIITAIGRLYLRNKQYDKAKEWFEEFLHQRDSTCPAMGMWYLEALFELGCYKKIREIVKKFTITDYGDEAKGALTLWKTVAE